MSGRQENHQTPPWTTDPPDPESPPDTPSTVTPSRPRTGITDLADELLTIIFEYCIEPKTEQSYYTPPLVLLPVCRRWFNVAISSSTLWTSILSGWAGPSRVAQWLQRSQPRLLTIQSGLISPFDEEVYRARKKDVFGLVLGEIHRWEKATMMLGELQTTEFLRRLQPESAFPLRTLELNLHHCPENMIPRLGQALDAACPNLDDLQLQVSCCDYTVLANFPIHRVPTITFDCRLTTEIAIYLMSRCTGASTIVIKSPRYMKEEELRPCLERTPLPTLNALRLVTSFDPVPFLKFFDLPELQSLEYELTRALEPRDEVATYFAEAEFKLTRLHILDILMDDHSTFTIICTPPLQQAQDVDIMYGKFKRVLNAIENFPSKDECPPWFHRARVEVARFNNGAKARQITTYPPPPPLPRELPAAIF